MKRVFVAAGLLTVLAAAPAAAQGPLDDFGQQRTYRAWTAEEAAGHVQAWLEDTGVKEDVREQVGALWEQELKPADGPSVLKRLGASFALADDRYRALVEFCSGPRQSYSAAEFPWLGDKAMPELVRSNLRLLYGRWLCQERLYDEALAQLEGLQPDDVADPASLLFYQGVAHHRLLQKEPGLKAIGTLLEEVADSPQRYVSVASLMQDDLNALKDKSLDHISRRMDDVGRRLELARAGKRVRDIERKIVDDLGDLIEELEKQQQQQQQQQQGGGTNRSTRPANDSRILGGSGPGEVDRRDIGSKSGWGNLPPKKRQEALQEVGKDFPSHYRDVIEQYFRRLAREDDRR